MNAWGYRPETSLTQFPLDGRLSHAASAAESAQYRSASGRSQVIVRYLSRILTSESLSTFYSRYILNFGRLRRPSLSLLFGFSLLSSSASLSTHTSLPAAL